MRTVRLVSFASSLIATLSASVSAFAQSAPPAEAPSAAPAEAPAPTPAEPAAASASGGFSLGTDGASASGSADVDATPAAERTPTEELEWRRLSLREHNSLSGAVGLLHTRSALSGAPGTFRLSFIGSGYAGTGFLCNSDTPCPNPSGGKAAEDDISRIGAGLTLSVTVAPFLEAYAGLHSTATSSDQNRPGLLQVLGDTNIGVKAFTPARPDSIFAFGGSAELWLLNGAGDIGLNGDGTSGSFRLLGTADFTHRQDPSARLPLRLHLNLGYDLDNSGQVVLPTEKSRGMRVTRTERLGMNVNRVDAFTAGVGVEGVFEVARPFVEWTIDVPVNRQDYTCYKSRTYSGDGCLGDDAGFSTTPSRVTLGVRATPFFDGLGLLAAFDIGTGATSSFIEEVSPQTPWTLYLGASYAFDTQRPQTVVERVEVEKPTPQPVAPPERFISGTVTEKGTGAAVPNAIVRYAGRTLTGMVADEAGKFTTGNLDPGSYTFSITADGYRPGECSATVSEAAPAGSGAPQEAPGAPSAPAQPADVPSQGGITMVNVQCELEALPKVGNVVGQLVDSASGAPIAGAKVTITDKLGRQLSLESDAAGSFRFENVVPGTAKVTVELEGYFTSVNEYDIRPREDARATIGLNKRPKVANVVVTANELKLKQQVHFQTGSAVILPDSQAIIEELAEVLRSKPEMRLEIQGHTDNTGTAAFNQRLSQERAEAVRAALVGAGIAADRLDAKGYGQDKPLAPNTSEANRAKNRRVALIVQK